MTDSTTKLLRDLAYQQMMLAKRLDSELYKQLKQQYSELCADYCDEVYDLIEGVLEVSCNDCNHLQTDGVYCCDVIDSAKSYTDYVRLCKECDAVNKPIRNLQPKPNRFCRHFKPLDR